MFAVAVESQLSQKTGNTRRLKELHVWCVKQYVVTLIAAERRQQAQEFLTQVSQISHMMKYY